MTVCLIYEEDHGVIGIAKNTDYAIKYLANTNRLNKNTGVKISMTCGESTEESLEEILGEEWIDKLSIYPINDLNSFFDGIFYFKEMEVFGA